MMLAYSYTRPSFSQVNQAPTLAASSLHQDIFHQPVFSDPALAENLTIEPPSLNVEMSSSTASARLPDEILSQIATYALEQAFCDLDVATLTSSARKPSFTCIEGMSRSSRRLRVIALSEWFHLFLVRHVGDWEGASNLKGMHSWVRHIICPPHALEDPGLSSILAKFPNLRSARLSLSCDYQFIPFQPSTNIYPSAPAERELQPGFAYRQPVTMFPPTVISLSVHSTHGSETPLLRKLGQQCPELRTLRLNKCTMFDCCTPTKMARSQEPGNPTEPVYYGQMADGSGCPFWGVFPFDHDIYFGSEGVEAYADELAAELAPLRKLEQISLGVYLTPHDSLAEHRLAHYPWRHLEIAQAAGNMTMPANGSNMPPGPAHAPTLAQHTVNLPPPNPNALFPFSPSERPPPPYVNPALWSYDCKACRKAYSDSTSTAERIAGLVLAKTLPKLKQIEWASFFESLPSAYSDLGQSEPSGPSYRRGTGTHKWRVVRDEAGTLLDLVQMH
ncbi:hypothetical protein B0J17DRAFT_641493 [Rhizoctonia solani]|nr:hypothetical protein B0J17DRAFT_641493 [Rhizoctonia solani]